MQPVRDIRVLKNELRQQFRNLREELTPERKARLDEAIARRVQALYQYKREPLLLIYVSTPIEADTRGLIRAALAQGKEVAVPRCVPGTREMEFYRIEDFDDLAPGSFGVLEPVPGRCRRLDDWSHGLCIVPGLGFDQAGFRLGYGKGYYDRFLSRFGGTAVGICYRSCVVRRLPHGRFDRSVEVLVTESYIRRTHPR